MAAKTLTLNLRCRLVKIHMTRRRAKAMDYLRDEIGRLEKIDPAYIKLDPAVNAYVLKNVAKRAKPVKVNVERAGENLSVKLFGEKKKEAAKDEMAKAAPSKPNSVTAHPEAASSPVKPAEKPKPAQKEEKPKQEQAKKPEANAKQAQAKPA